MEINKFKLWCMILVHQGVFAKRISELKCDGMASLNTDPRSLHPHLMEIIEIDSNTVRPICSATLISEDFVLTSSRCVTNMLQLRNLGAKVKIRKSKLPEEQYSNFSPHFGIKKTARTIKNGIELIQLNEPVPFHNDRSIFRPACLWTGTVDPSDLYVKYDRNSNILHIDSLIQSSEQLIKTRPGYSELFPEKTWMLYFNATNDFDIIWGSPVEVNVRNQIFIFGVILRHLVFEDDGTVTNNYLYYVPKISSFIEWIEMHVWLQLTDLECGQRKIKHKPLMISGQPSYHGEFPWHIALFKNNPKNQYYICGGTILSSRTILTAAHCVFDHRGILPPNRLTIVVGTHNLNEYPIEAETFSVETITPHQNYSREFLENDIALLKLGSVIVFSPYIQPICISNMLDYKNLPIGVVAGWRNDESNQQSDVLLQATFPVRDNFECRHSNRDFFTQFLNDHNYCAGHQNGTSACSGDAGGGMIVEFDSRWFIRGIVSLGVTVPNTGQCDTMEMVLFTDVPKFYDWIMKQLEDN